MAKVFGYPDYDENGVRTLCTYDNEYSAMMMDVRVYKMEKGAERVFGGEQEETAVLLLCGCVTMTCGRGADGSGTDMSSTESGTGAKDDGPGMTCSRKDVFTEGPYAAHVCRGGTIRVKALEDSEVLVQKTLNEKDFAPKLYRPEDAPWKYSSVGKFGNVAKRRVNTIFDYEHEPWANMVLGEVLNDRGNWSGYLPHRHPQPECYYFLFDRPEGFGASFVGDEVFKSVSGSFSAIPGGALHPQAVAPGFQMYTCWMIRHLEGNPWLQTDRCEDERYVWMHDAQF